VKLINELLSKINLSPNRRKVFKNVYWAVLGKIVNIISGLLVGILVARYLGPDQFGLMNYVISYVTLFSILAAFGLDGIEIRELSKHNAIKETLLGTAFTIRLIFSLTAILLILVTLLIFESNAFTFIMVMVYSLSLILSSLDVIRNYFTSIILNEYVVKTEISRTVIGSGIKVLLLISHCSLAWFIVASTFDFVLIGGGYLYSYQKKGGVVRAWRVDFTVARMLIRESFPLLLSGTAVIIYQKIDAVMIRNMMDNASVGQFSVASKITEVAIFVPMVIAQTVTPLLVKAHQHDAAQYSVKRQQFVDIMVWSSVAMAGAMSVIAAPAIRLLYGEKYLSAIPVLQIMAWKAVFMALFAASGQLIVIEGFQRYAAVRNVFGCMVSVGLNLLLIPTLGIIGSAVATVLTMAFSGYVSHFFIKPYYYLIPIQTKAVLFGWRRVCHLFSQQK
jgi:O-antigen/teichoic acid export membrane protein